MRFCLIVLLAMLSGLSSAEVQRRGPVLENPRVFEDTLAKKLAQGVKITRIISDPLPGGGDSFLVAGLGFDDGTQIAMDTLVTWAWGQVPEIEHSNFQYSRVPSPDELPAKAAEASSCLAAALATVRAAGIHIKWVWGQGDSAFLWEYTERVNGSAIGFVDLTLGTCN